MSEDDDLQAYLKNATHGLRRSTGQAVRSELLGHIDMRVQEYQLAGHSATEALRRTLTELGAPEYVQGGMQRVYVWPQALRGSVLGALACGAVYAMLHLSSVLAQVEGYHPAFTPLPGPYTYVEAGSLWNELAKAGVNVQGPPTAPLLHLPGLATPVQVNPGVDDISGFVDRTLILDYPSEQVFLDLNAVIASVTAAGADVRVEGWQNPTLHLGTVTLTLGTPEHPLDAYNLYDTALRPLTRTLGLNGQRSSRADDMSVFSHHALTVDAPAGTVFALVSVRQLSRGLAHDDALVLAYDIAQADATGTAHFRMAYDLAHLQLTTDPGELRADAEWLRAMTDATITAYATGAHPARALLVRLGGQLGRDTYRVLPRSGSSVGDQY